MSNATIDNKYKERMKRSTGNIKDLFKREEINALIEHRKRYEKIFRSSYSTEEKITRLMDVLLRVEANEQRLTQIRISLTMERSQARRTVKRLERNYYADPKYIKLKQKDQKARRELELFEYYEWKEEAEVRVRLTDKGLSHVKTLTDGLRTVIATLRHKHERQER